MGLLGQPDHAAATDEAARRRFAEIVVPHLDDAYALARWLSGSGADAEDIVQEASLRAYRAIANFGGGQPRAWVLTIVRNCALAGEKPSKSDRSER